jgi:Spy/CpxP family protein refolding chaperone
MPAFRSRLTLLCASAALVCVCASHVSAQGRGGFGGFGGGGFGKTSLIGNEQVQKELKVSDDQKKKLEEITDAYRDETRKLVPRDTPRDQFRAKFEETKGQRDKLTADAEAKIDGVLAIDQKERLDEIVIRVGGVSALQQDKMAEKLNLAADQRAKIKAVFEERDKKRQADREAARNNAAGARPDFNAMRERFEAERKETTEKVTAILTADQKASWEKMKGEPFELKFERGQGGPGGRNRRPSNN